MYIYKYFKKPFTGLQLLLQALGLLIVSLVIGIISISIFYEQAFLEVIKTDEFNESTFFRIFSLIASVFFLALQVRRVYALIQNLFWAAVIVLGIFAISIVFTYFDAKDPFFIYTGFKVLYWTWLFFGGFIKKENRNSHVKLLKGK
ncbi:hypothetical protein GWK08_00635 [Leptobacterium flavescens]|uniref:Uncharacterized protein n=1 Tax=Leptobacterium flavescens TaxID=472055 RepID=A0A6P0UH23_9FLAO|nr:hypothetical protein [Leptobacterium flavescens]NER11932.1 hypothetical protein [Leptobacterium flavescens]